MEYHLPKIERMSLNVLSFDTETDNNFVMSPISFEIPHDATAQVGGGNNALSSTLDSSAAADRSTAVSASTTHCTLSKQMAPKPSYNTISPLLANAQAEVFAGYTTDSLLDEDNQYSGRGKVQVLLDQMERAQSAEPKLATGTRMQEKTGAENALPRSGFRRNRPKAATASSTELVHQLKMVQLAQGWITQAEAKESLEESLEGSAKHTAADRLVKRSSYNPISSNSTSTRLGSERDDLTDRVSHDSMSTNSHLKIEMPVNHRWTASMAPSTVANSLSINYQQEQQQQQQQQQQKKSDSPNLYQKQSVNNLLKSTDKFENGPSSAPLYSSNRDSLLPNNKQSMEVLPQQSNPKKSPRTPIRRKRHFKDNIPSNEPGNTNSYVGTSNDTVTANGVKSSQSSESNSDSATTAIDRVPTPDNTNDTSLDSRISRENKQKSRFSRGAFVLVPSRKSLTMQPFGASKHLSTASKLVQQKVAPKDSILDIEFVSTPVLDLSLFTNSMGGTSTANTATKTTSNIDLDALLSPIPMPEDITPGEATRAAASFEEMIQPGCTPNLTPAPLAHGSISPQTPLMTTTSPEILRDEPPTSQPLPYRRKASKFFGVDEHAVAKAAAEQPFTPWFLKNEHTPMDLMYNMEGTVSSGTLRALIDQLTPHDSIADALFTRTFLTCFRLFCKPTDFAQLLYLRYALKPPSNLNNEECKTWLDKKLVPVRLRVFNIVKLWFESYWIPEEDIECLRDLKRFVAGPIMHMSPLLAKRLLLTMKEKVKRNRSHIQLPHRPSWVGGPLSADLNRRSAIMEHTTPVTAPLSGILTLFDIEPTELANQITLMEWDLFILIEPHELIGQSFSKKDDAIAPNVKAVVAFTRELTVWVTETIIFEADLKRRAEIVRYFIKLGDACFKLGNLDARLVRTWKLVSKRNMAILTNYIPLPCIPFLGLYLRDLTFIDDASSPLSRIAQPIELASPEPRIPFHKYLQTMRLIMELERFQSTPFQPQPLPRLQGFLARLLENSETDGDPEKLYFASLRLEPRK
ncbi:ras guanine nucleotide exchange factor domain-containing protein [Syncephalis fuscata]|nr:ras guanine nucleotide exchange factor domain-containing protein [Syncephalis fuscata]